MALTNYISNAYFFVLSFLGYPLHSHRGSYFIFERIETQERFRVYKSLYYLNWFFLRILITKVTGFFTRFFAYFSLAFVILVYVLFPTLLLILPTFWQIFASITTDLCSLPWDINLMQTHIINILLAEDDKLDWGDRVAYIGLFGFIFALILDRVKLYFLKNT